MTTITAQKRDMKVKAKKLRREGFVPGVICGKEVKGDNTIQIPENEAMKLIKECQKGEKVQLNLDGQKIFAIIKDYTYNALTNQVEVLDFQELVKGEKIHTSVEIVLKNEEMVEGAISQEISEVHYKADPDHLIDTIVIDLDGMQGVKSMKISDLEAFQDPEIYVSNPDAVIFHVLEIANTAETEEETAEE